MKQKINFHYYQNDELFDEESLISEENSVDLIKDLTSNLDAKINYDLKINDGLINGEVCYYCTNGDVKKVIITSEKINTDKQ